MKTSFYCGVFRAQRVITMAAALLLLFLHAHSVIAAPRIEWSPSAVEVTVPQGQSTTVTASFEASEDLDREVTVDLVPELAPFVTVVAPSAFAGLTAGETQTVEITFAASSDAPIEIFDGTLQLKDGRRALARPLPITLTIEEAPPGFPITVVGQVLFDDGRPVSGATVSGSIAEAGLTPAVQQESQQFLEATDYTNRNFKGRERSRPTQAFTLVESASDPETTTDDAGAFSFRLVADALPADLVVEVVFRADSLPAVETGKRATAESALLDVGTIIIPDPTASEMILFNGTAESSDGTVLVDGLPPEVNRLFARSFDPDEDPEAFPGEFAEMGQTPLDSSVFLWMEALDTSGNPVTDLSQAITIRAMVPESQWSDLEDIDLGTDRIEIPIYWFNEATNLWQQQGIGWLEDDLGTVLPEDAQALVLDGTFERPIFAALVSDHLSWVNVDYPYWGPWQLGRMPPNDRNNECFFNALKLADSISKSCVGRQALSKYIAPGGSLDADLADGQGPYISNSGREPDLFGFYDGDAVPPPVQSPVALPPLGGEDEFFLSDWQWGGCLSTNTGSTKRATTFQMAVTTLHETAHWLWDVKRSAGLGWLFPQPGGEAGIQLERDIFGGRLARDDFNSPTINPNLAQDPQAYQPLSEDLLHQWSDPSYWEGLSCEQPQFQVQNTAAADAAESGLTVTIAMSKPEYELGGTIEVDVQYKNSSATSIKALRLLALEGWPLWFNIVRSGESERNPFLGPRVRVDLVPESDFVTLQPGQNYEERVNLSQDPDTGRRLYHVATSGAYQVTGYYSGHWGLGEVASNTVTFVVTPGGSISGTVTDATNGQPIAGGSIKVIRDGDVVATAATGQDGGYEIPELPPGEVTLEASALGFLRSTRDVTVVAGTNTVANFSLSPLLTAGEVRMVLTWGQSPSDLDAHLWLPMEVPYHVAFFRRGSLDECPFAALDTDVTSGFGPETITISQRFLTGTYTYAVFNFSSSPPLAGSGAQVQVFDSSGQIATIDVPATGSGSWWNVLTIDGETGALTEVNELGDNPEPYPDTDAGCATP